MAMDMFAIMLKNLGINPDEIKQQIQAFATATIELTEAVKRIEVKVDANTETLARIERQLKGNVKPTLTIEG